ncbi:MAG TPA: UvrD-helicase domain-containing protein [Planctomycetaceae bacterium]|nr:UvrD-helicase domain-containing protein [Planctomycetaceae bacterium]
MSVARSPAPDRLRDLNERQREAVLTLAGPVLVLAGAGTGKTRVITYRAAELIRRGTPAERILSVTFTNKAAREMQQRTAVLLGPARRGTARPLVTTFHSLCVRILRQEATHLGYPLNFAIYDRSDQESAARAALREIRVSDKTLRPGDLVQRISRWKSAGVSPQRAGDFVETDLDMLAAAAYRRYQQAIKSRGGVDFDDLLLLTNRLFEEFPEVLDRHQRRFDHLQIDEYQDTNGTQFALAEALVRPHHSICVVGDDDQSIYGWRGAEVRHILEFHTIFPGTRVIRLEQNYRSNPAILAIANRLAAQNPGRHAKRLEACRPMGGEVRFRGFEDEQAEAAAVVAEIAALVEAGANPGDVAILFRTNEQPRLFEAELRRRRLRYVVIGGQSFFDRKEIRDLLAYLKVIARPDDEQSLLRIINTPPRGIGDAAVDKLMTSAVKSGRGLWDIIAEAEVSAGPRAEISAKAAAGLAELRNVIGRFREDFEALSQPLPDLFQKLVEDIRYEAEVERLNSEPEQRLSRLAALEQLRDAIKIYADRAELPSLAGFLEDCALAGRDEEQDDAERENADVIRLMTLHSAKGLEFPRVYLVGLEEGLLPHRRSLEDPDSPSLPEERRLAYVGVTRAMNDLTITWAESRTKWGKRQPTIVSRFIGEMRADNEEGADDEQQPPGDRDDQGESAVGGV